MANIHRVKDKSVDLVILDPNYQDWDNLCSSGLLEHSTRVLKDTGNIICFTKQPFDYNLRININNMFRREFSWSFENGGAWVSNKMPLVSFQKIYWCTPSKNFFFNPRTGLEYSSRTKEFKRSTKVFEGYCGDGRQFKKSDEGLWMRDHYHYNKPSMGPIPAKPLELIEIFVRCMSKPGDTVLDPFMGSGTTAIACIRNNRNFIGFEINKDYCQKANERIQKEQSQPTLF